MKATPITPHRGMARPSAVAGLARVIARLVGLIRFVLRRQWHHRGVTSLALLGVVLAVGLFTTAPVFSQAVDTVLLLEELAAFSGETGRPPFATTVYVLPSANQPLSLPEAEELAGHIAGTLSSEVGLPIRYEGLMVSSGSMMLQPSATTGEYGDELRHLASVALVHVDGVAAHLETVAGEPFQEEGTSGEMLDVWMHARLAEEMGVQAGDEFNVSVTLLGYPTAIRVKGFWQADDPQDPFWFKDPNLSLRGALLVRREDYVARVQPMIAANTRAVDWLIVLDERKVVPDRARQYLDGFERSLAIINKYLPGARLNTPPLDPLGVFVQREGTLAALLLSFSVPALGFVLYFLAMISAIIAAGQQQEIATLTSRGAGMSGVLAVTVIDELLLFVIGLPLGIGLGMALSWLMGFTVSFLRFTSRPLLPLSLRGISVPLIVVALAVAMIARIVPAVFAARRDVADLEQERLRPVRGPFWYRYYLDLLLLIPTAYAYRQLQRTGSLSALVGERATDLYQDPLLIIVPALFVLAAALITMRIFPLLMRAADRLAGMTPSIAVHLALRQLGRQSQSYISPLLLVIVALALGVYSYSLAGSLDQWLIDRTYYHVGADLKFVPSPKEEQDPPSFGGAWMPLPEEFDALPGVRGATRVADYPMATTLSAGRAVPGRFLAIDRDQLAAVMWDRRDLTGEPLGELMNRLALAPDNILVSQSVLEQSFLKIGDQLRIRIVMDGQQEVSSLFSIAGAYQYFPTVYEEESVTIIGNLDYLSTLAGTTAPHAIWLRLDEGADGDTVLEQISRTMNLIPGRPHDARQLIAEAQADLSRVGVFGTLSVGFLAAVFMAAVGLMVYSYASLRPRVFRFSVLRAVGLTYRQIIGQVVLEYGVLTVYGAAAGALIGAGTSQYFAPFFTITGEARVPLPPLIPIIARDALVILAVSFVAVMVAISALVIATTLSRRRFDLLRVGGR